MAEFAGAIVAAQGYPPRNSNKCAVAKVLAEIFGKLTPAQLGPIEVQRLAGIIVNRSGTAHARYYRLAALRSILRELQQAGAPHGLDNAVPRHASPRPRAVVFSDAEVDALIRIAPLHQRCLILLCHHAALRSGTATKVAPEHYDPVERCIRIVTKGGSPLGIPTTAELDRLFAIVGRHKPKVPYVDQLRHKGINAFGYRQEFKRLCKQAGIEGKTLHDLRRTTAVKVMNITRDIRVVQHLLGHRNLETTLWYLDHDGEMLDHATLAEALRR